MRTGTETKSIGPLVCWDVFMQGYRQKQQLADDRSALEKMAKEQQWQQLFDFRQQLFEFQKTILVTTPAQKIVYASSSLYNMNGYFPAEVIGHTPHIFQGYDTDEQSRDIVRGALKSITPFETTIVNYRKNGSLYNCHIKGFPLFNKHNKLVNYIAFENIAL